MFTVLGGLAMHLCVVLPLLVKFLGGMSPAGVLPQVPRHDGDGVQHEFVERHAADGDEVRGGGTRACRRAVSRFVLPLSASMNHNGTALFESVTVLFLAQVFGVDLDLGQQLWCWCCAS